nr:reverse transcriptase domain-containing protein [Tanacetum cinerariifolium]
MLGEHNITYRPRTSVKGQILVDFLVEKPNDAPPEASMIETLQEPWTLFTDGSSCVDRSEYEALVAGLQIAAQMGVRNVHMGPFPVIEKRQANSVSRLVVGRGSLQAVIPKAMAKIETKAVATITGSQVKKFVWDNIVCRFGLPGEIVSDNGKQFSDNPFKDWCEKLNITQRFALVKHPQSNGLVERANRSLGKGIKARLAVIPAKIRMPTYRTVVVDAIYNNEELRLNPDLLEERRECAAIREAKAKLKMTKYYNTRVRGVTFRPRDFVYRSNEASHAMDGGKLGPKWE